MAYLEYTPGNPVDDVEENLRVVGRDAWDEKELVSWLLLSAPDFIDLEYLDQVKDAEPDNMPAGALSRVTANLDVNIIDKNTNLALESTWRFTGKEGFRAIAYPLRYEPLDPQEDAREPEEWPPEATYKITDSRHFIDLVAEHGFTHYAYQMQPGSEENSGDVIEHFSLGFAFPEGGYIAMVTLPQSLQGENKH